MALGLLTGDLIVGDEFPVLRRPDHTGLKHRLELLRSPIFGNGLLQRGQHAVLGRRRDRPLRRRSFRERTIFLKIEAGHLGGAGVGSLFRLRQRIGQRALKRRTEVRRGLIGAGMHALLGCDLKVGCREPIERLVIPAQQRNDLGEPLITLFGGIGVFVKCST